MIYLVKTLQPFSGKLMALFVCLYRNITGLSAALFVLCHPVDLLAFNQKEKISFYMLLQNSKRWHTVITDKRLSRAKGRKNASPLFALFCFLLPGKELKEKLMLFLWGNKDQKSCTQIKMQMCSSMLLCCQGRKGKHWSSWENKDIPKYNPGRQCQRSHSGCPHTLKQTHQTTAPGNFCFVNLVWKCPGNHESLRNFPSCQFFPCSIMLLLPIYSLQKTHLF